uniref:Uncharacterized protein n=1 Tax=Opuntia streptacantha TaxID=393608 RepID=A0A7C9AP87_OPUST
MDDLGAKEHYRLPSSFRKDQRSVGIITCLLCSGCDHHMTRVNILLCSGDNFLSQGPDLSAGCADGSYSIEQGAGSAPTSGSRTLEMEPILSMISSSSDVVHYSETPGLEDASLGTISSSGFYGQRMAVLDSLKQISEAGSSSNLGQVSKAWEFRLVHLGASSSAKSCIAIQSPFYANSQEYPVVRTMACVRANSRPFRHLTAIGSSDSRALPLEASMLLVVILITEWVMAQALTGYLPFFVLLSPPIQKDHSKRNLGIPHVFSSLGMVQDQEPKTLILLHAHIVPRMVMDMSWSYCCHQNLDIWATLHIFRVHWCCSMGGYSRGSEHPNTLQAVESIMAEGCWIFLRFVTKIILLFFLFL